eukprot:4657315-Pleurochrysis_carterae.AAC.2
MATEVQKRLSKLRTQVVQRDRDLRRAVRTGGERSAVRFRKCTRRVSGAASRSSEAAGPVELSVALWVALLVLLVLAVSVACAAALTAEVGISEAEGGVASVSCRASSSPADQHHPSDQHHQGDLYSAQSDAFQICHSCEYPCARASERGCIQMCMQTSQRARERMSHLACAQRRALSRVDACAQA